MKNVLSNYKQSLILLVAILLGAILGLIMKEDASFLSPFGDIFLNLMLVIIIPLVFLNISTSIAKIKQPKRLGKIMCSIVLVFIITSLIAVFVGIISTYFINLVDTGNSEIIKQTLEQTSEPETQDLSILERTVSAITVNDFAKLFSKDNLIAIIIFSILFGCALKMSGEKSKPVLDFLVSANDVIMSLLKIIMYYAPIGLGCYFAALIGTLGASIAVGYLKTFIIYTIICILFYIIIYSLYAFVAAGRKGVSLFWKNIFPATITSIATCSSAASIPVNITASKNIGVSDDIAETVIPLGTNFHKDGSIIGSVFKIMFLVCFFGTNIATFGGTMRVVLVTIIATLFVTAVPIGGGTISEMMILTMMGYPVYALPILTIIATIIDAPATMLNVVGDTSCSMLVSRIVDGKNWLKKQFIH